MKKLIYFVAVAGLLFTGCNPLSDINTAIDAQAKPIVGDATYTLTDADYSALKLTYGSFSSIDDAKSMLPGFLSKKYPVWGKGSSVLLGYKLYVGLAPGVSDYTTASSYTLANSDYPGASDNAVGFYPDQKPADYMDAILTANVANPVEGQKILVKYKQYVGTPVLGISNYFETDFTDGTLGSYEAVNVLGDQVWTGTNYGAKMSGYSGGAQDNEDWLISPEIDLTAQTNLSFQISQIINYASGQLDLLNIMVSSDYTTGGDPSTATWDTITLANAPDGTSWTPVTSEDYDFSAYEGKKIHIAFKYQSNTSVAASWEIENLKIKTPGVEGETTNIETYYTYSGGNWSLSQGVYPLTTEDYDSMGQASGQPGKYNNFDSSMDPDAYISTFLGVKYPYAQDGDHLVVVYKYYSKGTQTRGNLYTFTNGSWSGAKTTIETTLQFANDGSTWVPDNTIKYEFVAADYQYIVDTFGNVSGYESAVANLSNYGNISTFNWTADQIDAAINAVLMHNYPGMSEGQKFSVTIYVYDGSSHNTTINYILTGGVYVRNM